MVFSRVIPFHHVPLSFLPRPGVVILSQLCPPGLEATMYALLAGCHNLGGTISSATGAWVLQVLEVQPSGAKD